MRFAPIAVLTVLLTLLVACGADPAPTPVATPPPPTPVEILEKASKQLAETSAAGFTLVINGDTWIDPTHTIRLLSAEGDLLRPGSVRTSFKAEVLGRTISLELITVDERTWLTNIVNGKWEPAPLEFAYRPSVLFDNQNGIGPVMGRVEDIKLLPDETIEGQLAYHVQGDVPGEIINPLSYYTLKGSPVTVDLWVAKETFNLLRAKLSEPPGDDRPNPAVWTLTLMRHGEKVTIEPPI